MYKLILFIVFSFIVLSSSASSDTLAAKPSPAIDFYFHTGQIIKNYPHLPNSNRFMSGEVYMGYVTNGNQNWHSHFGFPQIGVSVLYNDFGNNAQLGQSISFLPNITFRQGNSSKFYSELRIGFGMAIFNKHYDLGSNPENLYIGSTITNISFASFNAVKFLSDKIAIKAGITTFHFSNGHYQLPNIGLNIPAIVLGVKYLPHGMPQKFIENRIENYDKNIRINARLGIAWHEFGYSTFPSGGPKYPIYMATVYASKRITAVNNLQLGFFYNYYTSFYDFMTMQEIFTTGRHLKSSVVSVFLGHEFIAGHVSFVAQAGINLYNPFQEKFVRLYDEKPNFSALLKTWSSNKLGVQYYPIAPEKSSKHKFYVGIYIKANLGQADFVEYGAGYTF